MQNLTILLAFFLQSELFKKIENCFRDRFALKELALAPLQILASLSLVLILVFIIEIYKFFHSYLIPNNFKNIELFLKTKEYNSSEVLYFNDKYIFIQHSDKDGNKTIEISMFDELFNKKTDK